MNLFQTVIPVDPEILRRHTRTIVAPEMQNCAEWAPTRLRRAKAQGNYGKCRELILAYLRGVPSAPANDIGEAIEVYPDHVRVCLRALESEGKVVRLQPRNQGAKRAAIWGVI